MSQVSTSLHLTCLLKMDLFSSAGYISSNVLLNVGSSVFVEHCEVFKINLNWSDF